ncbi:UDP-N-acetylmuramoyl-tripeptide--D-alanyl-D-alanine ligase [Lewinella cohaerens]|uniref:UDP-N-acetylmuramoyl-tripeptide--D-alanyl-D- alanine ligase n=1 Tax=Lewinella cohaerens TaxID=70995 RepID=UPI000374D297|nr:UDP-N-acetylmuramoyl-tripeptide--D-alanyl-D-alanine ligase [Lewinella cohaerens]
MAYTTVATLLQHFSKCQRVCTDTRKLLEGDLFFALKGDNFDGNRFAAQALKDGAAFVVVDDSSIIIDERYLLVEDTLLALQNLARAYRQQLNIPIVAITGSNGKTTTKELVAAVLSKAHQTHFTQGNFNNHIGVPLTLLAMPLTTEIAVIEMGANHQGEIAELCEIAEPTHGLITNIGKAHLEGFGGIEGVKKGKSELYTYLATHQRVAFINLEEDYLEDLAIQHGVNRKIDYCLSTTPDPTTPFYEIRLDQLVPKVKVSFLKPDGNIRTVESSLSGRHNLQNIMTAIAVGKYFKVSSHLIVEGIAEYVPSNNRSQRLEHKEVGIYLDAYNANPSSMRAALQNFAAEAKGPQTVILGDMLELGQTAATEHLDIAQLAQSLAFANITLVGPLFAAAAKELGLPHFLSAQEVSNALDWSALAGTELLIKGSRGMKLELLLEQ